MDFAWAKQESPPKDAKNIDRMYFVSEAVSTRPTLTTPLVTSTSPVTSSGIHKIVIIAKLTKFDKLKKALVQPDDTMNFTAYEGKDTNPKEVIDLSETLPFFADRRVILIENSGFFKGSCEELAEYMPQVPDTTLFLFVEEEVDKRSKMYKAVKKDGKIVEFATQTEELLTRWILSRLKKEGKNITGSVMQLFLKLLP